MVGRGVVGRDVLLRSDGGRTGKARKETMPFQQVKTGAGSS